MWRRRSLIPIRLCHRSSKLLGSRAGSLQRSVARLSRREFHVVVGAVAGFFEIQESRIVLDNDLFGEGPHPLEHGLLGSRPTPAERVVACILEAVATTELSRRLGRPPQNDWVWVGAAIFIADSVGDHLSTMQHDSALAIRQGNLSMTVRGGAAVLQAWKAFGVDPVERASYVLAGGVISEKEWLRVGAWVYGVDGLSATLPRPVAPVADVCPPCSLQPYSWAPVAFTPSTSGNELVVTGPGAVDRAFAIPSRVHRTLACATHSSANLTLGPGGPVGRFELVSLQVRQSLGAQGVVFVFKEDGTLSLELNEAFIGPLASAALFAHGRTGAATGQWCVAGRSRLRLTLTHINHHNNNNNRGFRMPRSNFGLSHLIEGLKSGVWAWAFTNPYTLVFRGQIGADVVELRMRNG